MDEKYSQLSLHIQSLTDSEKKLLAERISASEIEMVFSDMREVIAQEAKNRIQSKIALTFNRGYGTGELFNSIYYKIDGDSISISSTKNYFAILNHGIKSFDMKEALLGKRVKMRLPGGAIIYRSVGDSNKFDPRKKKNPPKSGGWIYPGYSGAHIYETVNEEIQVWMNDYVNTQVRSLLERAKARNVWGHSLDGKKYHNVRDERGKFTKLNNLNTPFSKLLKEDMLKFKYVKTPIGAISPILPRTGKYVSPGEQGYNPKKSIERMHNANLGRK